MAVMAARAAPVLFLLLPAALAAQSPRGEARLELTLSYVRSRALEAGVARPLDGVVPGGRGHLAWDRFRLELQYAEATLDGEGAGAENFVDAHLLGGVAVLPGLSVLGGVRAHALTDQGDETRRWLFWTAGVHLETPRFARGLLVISGDLWAGLARANGVDGTSLGRGIETAVIGWHPSMPVFARLGYRLDEGRLVDAALRSTVEQLTLGVGYVF